MQIVNYKLLLIDKTSLLLLAYLFLLPLESLTCTHYHHTHTQYTAYENICLQTSVYFYFSPFWFGCYSDMYSARLVFFFFKSRSASILCSHILILFAFVQYTQNVLADSRKQQKKRCHNKQSNAREEKGQHWAWASCPFIGLNMNSSVLTEVNRKYNNLT